MNIRHYLFSRARNGLGIAALALALAVGGNAGAESAPETVPVVGLDASGNSLVQEVPTPLFRHGMNSVLASVQDSLSPVLASHSKNEALAPAWELRNVSIGVTFTGTLGLGPVWSLSGTGRLRLVYSDSLNPVYPD
jgi:hypothetical protein